MDSSHARGAEANVCALAEGLGPALSTGVAAPAVLVGHSLGGLVALEYAAANPQRVAGLVLVSVPADAAEARMTLMERLLLLAAVGPVRRYAPEALIRRSLSRLFAIGFDAPQNLVDEARRLDRHAARDAARGLRHYFAAVSPLASATRLEVPALYIRGDQDQIVTARAAEAFSRYGRLQVHTLAGVGHSPTVEAPRATAALIEDFALGHAA